MTIQPNPVWGPHQGRSKTIVAPEQEEPFPDIRQSRHRRDLVIVVAIGLAVVILGAAFDGAEALKEIFTATEAFELDEVILGLAVVGLLGFWYASRRWADQRAQVAHLKELRASLIRANIELEQASGAKSVFLAQMSHELRTPLNAVIGFADALQAGLYGTLNDKQADTVRMVGDSGRILLNLVADILDVSRIETGKVELSPEPTDLQCMVRQSLTAVEEDAQKHGATMRVETDGSSPTVSVDRVRTRQMLVNLITNAIRYGRSQQPIRIRLSTELASGTAIIAVIDHGPGMTEQQLEDATKPFVAFSGKRPPEAGSAGLGLSIAAGLAELQGGRLDLSSSLGLGTTVRLHLPLAGTTNAETVATSVIALAS